MPFQNPSYDLGELLSMVADGRIQLPDFQRPWKWDDERIRSLLATVTMDYPLGVMMTLETGGSGARFKPRPLAGVTLEGDPEPGQLLMDGQQRMTSLYQALKSGQAVETWDGRKNEVRCWYYIHIDTAISDDGDREEAVLSVPEDRIVRDNFGRGVVLDLSSKEKECAEGYFPLRLAFDIGATQRWMWQYAANDPERQVKWEAFTKTVLDVIAKYRIPVITLTKTTPKEAVCTVFEKVNTGGVTLTVFELLTATYAGDREYFRQNGHDFQLLEHWQKILEDLSEHRAFNGQDETERLASSDFLQAVCLVATQRRNRAHASRNPGVPVASCKRKDILNLPLEEYLTWAPQVVEAYHWIARFLAAQGIFKYRDLPYRTQLVPLAAIRTLLGVATDEPEALDKITRWYWCGVLGEQYSGALESRFPRDLEQVIAWVRGGREPESVTAATFRAARLDKLQSRNSAAYKGVYALVLRQGCYDWTHSKDVIDATIFEEQQVDVVRIFPKAWCEKNGIPADQKNSIINKTPLTTHTARIIGSRSPSVYMRALETETGLPANWLDDAVSTHLIDAADLRAADFKKFYATRHKELIALIEDAMGRLTIPAETAPESAADYQEVE
ncbi:GmrSD restriction endonuclease domain-containing protein [Microbispora sp. CA-102843]|uniref:GmrSD restriction endonuclease domain-containing protein n=1 Tax=Microbispora sp. CA-102843 TaxID=3239952 RepID=UPI003D8A26E8